MPNGSLLKGGQFDLGKSYWCYVDLNPGCTAEVKKRKERMAMAARAYGELNLDDWLNVTIAFFVA